MSLGYGVHVLRFTQRTSRGTSEETSARPYGRLQGTPPEVMYTPAPGFAGADAFSFRVSDGQSTLTVSNVPPGATVPERQSLQVGESLCLPLSASDVAGAEDPLTWKKLSGPGAAAPLLITSAYPEAATGRLYVYGEGFGTTAPTAVFAGLPVTVVASTDTTLTLSIPFGLINNAGTYLISVSRGLAPEDKSE